MEISIIGGGIGGLALANALKSMGIKFHLYERATKFTEVGAGIGLSESTLQILDKIGLYNLAKSNGKFVERAILANKNLKTLRVIPTESEGMCIDRTKLIEILSANISEDEYTLNEELESFQRKEGKMMMNFSSGKKLKLN
ncbi:FAD-dependent monooxygenase [Polaribacter sp.]|nr:FAD-dependent monooxygenase [Polaribacter sp.]